MKAFYEHEVPVASPWTTNLWKKQFFYVLQGLLAHQQQILSLSRGDEAALSEKQQTTLQENIKGEYKLFITQIMVQPNKKSLKSKCTCSSQCAVTTGGNNIAGFESVPAKICLPDSLLVCPSSTNSLTNLRRHQMLGFTQEPLASPQYSPNLFYLITIC